MRIHRQWAMPNKYTFSIKPINELIQRYLDWHSGDQIIDPFGGNSPFKDRCITNDLDPDRDADYHMDAIEFLRKFKDKDVELILFDPPYSPRQVSECYKKLDLTVNMQTTQASFWGDMKNEIARIAAPDAHVITCGWNSGGIGKTKGFIIEEILLVPHGGWHNDTIVTVERFAP